MAEPTDDETTRRIQRVALTALIAGAVAIGFAPIFAKISEAGPVSTAFWRMALSLPLLWWWMYHDEGTEARNAAEHPPPKGKERWLLMLAGAFFAIDLAIWHWSLRFTTVANSTLIANMAPIFVTLGAWKLYKERPTPVFAVGLVTALGGAALLMGASFGASREQLLGDLLALGAAVFYGSYMLSLKGLRGRHPVPRIMAWSGITASIILLPIALIGDETLLATTATGWAILLGLALLSHAGGQSLIAFAMAHLSAGFSSVTLLLQPVISAVIAWVLLGEILGPMEILGGIVVLAGIVLARVGTAPRRVPVPVSRSP